MLNAPERRTDAVRAEMSRFWSSFETALRTSPLAVRGVDETLDTAAKRIVQ